MAPHATGSPPLTGESLWTQNPQSGRPRFYDSDPMDSIAVVGYSLGFPQDTESSEDFWRIMVEKRNTATAFPKSRMNINGIYHPDTERRGQIPVCASHFIREDIGTFDAPFFGTSSTDAECMDPQQRLLLEYTYKALENAGMPMEDVSGTKTSVYTGVFSTDWQHLAYKDGEQCKTTTALGVQACFNANRVSWFFNFTGNSANIDTACSSSLVCLDLGCQGLRSGDEDMSVVAGCNLILSPDNMHSLTNLNMLSPDGQCYSFDHRGNGYSRGEGFGVLVLKRVSDAIRDNDTIRGIIRSTGSNQDGRTSSITLPNHISQEGLIRDTYKKAGLSMEPTRFFEAHGTGTAAGDPIESKALGSAFRQVRTTQDPLWVGAVKSNIGHLEGASGIAGVIKALLILERGIIPPNTNFEQINPKIDTEFLRIQLPLDTLPWPSKGLRRASVNSFGDAGTNAHVVLDDVYHFLEQRRLHAHHTTIRDPPSREDIEGSAPNGDSLDGDLLATEAETGDERPRILTFSSNDEKGIKRQVKQYAEYFQKLALPQSRYAEYIDDLAYTLSFRRSSLMWKSFAVLQTPEDLQKLDTIISPARKSISNPSLVFIFTGQGAQWAGMGRELLVFPSFQRSILEAEEYFLRLGSEWQLRKELLREKDSRINSPEIAQPACTAIQIALLDLLKNLNTYPTAVIGHSSGEIAAAYSTGAISNRSAWRLAYFRGALAGSLATSGDVNRGMLAVGLSSDSIQPYLDRVTEQFGFSALTLACINSPKNVTISGDGDQLNTLRDFLEDDEVFARKLAVNVAYHSPFMREISDDYREKIRDIEKGQPPLKTVAMFSSVTGGRASEHDLATPDYWVSNMVLPVKFVDAMKSLFSKSAQRIRKKLDLSHRNYFSVNMLVEIGPHSALAGPVNDTLIGLRNATDVGYAALLKRKTPATSSMLNAIGQIQCLGYPIKLELVNYKFAESHKPGVALPDLPGYVFDHSKSYWDESRYSRNNRTQEQGKLDLLGKPVTDWNPLEPRWRNFLRVSEMPWVEDHVINGSLIYPGAGMLVMAIEAANQLTSSDDSVLGFELSDVQFIKSLSIPQDATGAETQLVIHRIRDSIKPLSTWCEFRLFAIETETWQECCRGFVKARYEQDPNSINGGVEDREELNECLRIDESMTDSCATPLETDRFYDNVQESGFGLGPSFQRVMSGALDDQNHVKGLLRLYEWPENEYPQPHVIHPTSLDAIFHLAIAGPSKGGNRRVPTMIPTFMRKLFVSKVGLQCSEASDIRENAWMKTEDSRATTYRAFALDSLKESILLQFDDLVLTKIGEAQKEVAEEELQAHRLSYNIAHKPDPNHLSSDALLTYCQQNSGDSVGSLNIYLDILAHKNPDIKILAVDPADEDIISGLMSNLLVYDDQGKLIHANYGSLRVVAEDQSVVDQMREKLKAIPYSTYDVLKVGDVADEDLESHQYDLVLASQAIQTNEKMLQNISQMIDFNGKLLLYKPEQEKTPSLDLANTTNLLSKNKFETSGVEMSIESLSIPSKFSVSVHNVLESDHSQESKKRIFIVMDSKSGLQIKLSQDISCLLQSRLDCFVETMGLDEASKFPEKGNAVFIVLLELDQPFLYSISQESYQLLKDFFLSTQDVLWINPHGGSVVGRPEYAPIYGLARALRNELDSRITITSLDFHDQFSEWQMNSLYEVLLGNHMKDSPKNRDVELLELDGCLTIPRIVPAGEVTREIALRSRAQNSGLTVIKDAPPLELTMGSPGLLDTLHFVEDKENSLSLADDEVEIQTKAIGMNFKDCLIALGQIGNATMGQECAGIVTRAGSRTDFKEGDRIALAAPATFKTYVRGKAYGAFKIPDGMEFTTAAAIPSQFGTAWEVVHRMARLQKGESILIHAAAGGTGQAAIQVAQSIGAEIYATVGSTKKKQILMDEYRIPESHIFYSRNTSFAKGVHRMTQGRGVDVVVNSLVGEGLLASWECIAPYGRFVEIGKKDINSNSSLPMFAFGKNASFIAFDGARWLLDRPLDARNDLQHLIDRFADKTFHTPSPFQVFDVSEVEKVFRLVQDGENAGKLVMQVAEDSSVPTTLDTKPSFQFDPDASYVIAGGLGGIGRATARWMASRGARNLILLSRYGPRTDLARELLEELKIQKVHVETPACDITNLDQSRIVFNDLSSKLPPIKGCMQMSIVAADCLFQDLEYDGWQVAVDCKAVGSWNLHTVLPTGMDFFVLLSSASGLAGIRGQTNYDAGNTYEDTFARYRVSRGEKAVSFDLGAMVDDGILAENQDLLNRVLGYGTLEPVTRQKFHAMLDYYCNPSLPLLSPVASQVAVGLGIGGGSGLDSFNHSRQPMLLPLEVEGARQAAATANDSGDDGQINGRELLATSSSMDEAGEVVRMAVVKKLGKSLASMQDAESIDIHKPLQMYGVDSLLAIELRNWIVKEFLADIAVFETQGASTLGTLSMLVAGRSAIGHDKWSISAA